MKYTVSRVDAHQTSLTLGYTAALLAVLSSVFAGISLLLGNSVSTSFSLLFTISGSGIIYNILMLLINPLLSFVVTYLAVYLFCALYNFVSGHTGGIRIYLEKH